MTETEILLCCLAEECAEVAQRVSKALRFGLGERQPGQPLDNAERIVDELNDLITVADMLVERGILKSPLEEKAEKYDKVMRYLDYSMGRTSHPHSQPHPKRTEP